MDAVLRAAAVYVLLLIVLRASGRRTLGELTAFDFVLVLIIGEATQQALVGRGYSLTNAAVVIVTLVGLDIVISLVKRRWAAADRWIDGVPMVLVEDGRPLKDRMRKARVDEADVMAAARGSRGLERMSQVKWAVLETSGEISIIPK
ncbi:MAG: YetF domain-containing protein [Phycisphaerales bacterium]